MKSILIHLTDGANVESSITTGLDLAQRFNAPADGLFAIPSLSSTFWGYEAAEYLPILEQKLEQAAATAIAAFDRLAAGPGVKTSANFAKDAFLSTVANVAQGYDLLVTPQPKDTPDSVVEMEFQAADLIVHCACPTLVVPRGEPIPLVGSRILIAWNNSREAGRAVRDALPLLTQADQITVLAVKTAHHDLPSTHGIQDLLNRHGIRFQLEQVTTAPHQSITDAILTNAASHQSNLLVMGAWGHSRVRELVLGGATRGILESTTIPVLMSH